MSIGVAWVVIFESDLSEVDFTSCHGLEVLVVGLGSLHRFLVRASRWLVGDDYLLPIVNQCICKHIHGLQ